MQVLQKSLQHFSFTTVGPPGLKAPPENSLSSPKIQNAAEGKNDGKSGHPRCQTPIKSSNEDLVSVISHPTALQEHSGPRSNVGPANNASHVFSMLKTMSHIGLHGLAQLALSVSMNDKSMVQQPHETLGQQGQHFKQQPQHCQISPWT